MVQVEDLDALADRPLMPATTVLRSNTVTVDADSLTRSRWPMNRAGTRVLVAAHHHLRIPIHPRILTRTNFFDHCRADTAKSKWESLVVSDHGNA